MSLDDSFKKLDERSEKAQLWCLWETYHSERLNKWIKIVKKKWNK